MFKAEYIAFL